MDERRSSSQASGRIKPELGVWSQESEVRMAAYWGLPFAFCLLFFGFVCANSSAARWGLSCGGFLLTSDSSS